MTKPKEVIHSFLDGDNVLWEVCMRKDKKYVPVFWYFNGDDKEPRCILVGVKDIDKLILGLKVAKGYHEFNAIKEGKKNAKSGRS